MKQKIIEEFVDKIRPEYKNILKKIDTVFGHEGIHKVVRYILTNYNKGKYSDWFELDINLISKKTHIPKSLVEEYINYLISNELINQWEEELRTYFFKKTSLINWYNELENELKEIYTPINYRNRGSIYEFTKMFNTELEEKILLLNKIVNRISNISEPSNKFKILKFILIHCDTYNSRIVFHLSLEQISKNLKIQEQNVESIFSRLLRSYSIVQYKKYNRYWIDIEAIEEVIETWIYEEGLSNV